MSLWIEAGLWGLAAGSALVIGAAIGWFVRVPQRVVASVMAFGAGVLISALAFDLVDEAERSGGLLPTSVGFLAGGFLYVAANVCSRDAGRDTANVPAISGFRRPTSGAAAGRSPSAPCSTVYLNLWCSASRSSVVVGLAPRSWLRSSCPLFPRGSPARRA